MKKLLLFISLIITGVCVKAQNKETTLPIPNYRITRADSSIITQAALNTRKPVMFIYFEPTCSHCEHLMMELKPYMNQLKKIQVVMVTYTKTEYPYLKMLKEFNTKYSLSKYPNFTVGTEYNHFNTREYPMQKYYAIYNTPFIVVYNGAGKVVKSFTVVPKVEDLLAAIKKA